MILFWLLKNVRTKLPAPEAPAAHLFDRDRHFRRNAIVGFIEPHRNRALSERFFAPHEGRELLPEGGLAPVVPDYHFKGLAGLGQQLSFHAAEIAVFLLLSINRISSLLVTIGSEGGKALTPCHGTSRNRDSQ